MPRTSDARERIVTSAARLFLERSYQAVGVDELCRAADVRKGSFYHYFPSKSELAKAVIDLHAEAFARRLSDSPRRRLRSDCTPSPTPSAPSRPRSRHSSDAPSDAHSVTSPPSCRPPTTTCAPTSPACSPQWNATSPRCVATRPRLAYYVTAPTQTDSPTRCWRNTRASSCWPRSTTPAWMRSRPHCTTSSTATSSTRAPNPPTRAARAPTASALGRDAIPHPSRRG